MKKTISFLKKYQLIGVFIGLLISVITIAVAESINSNEVLYDNSSSLSNSENVKDALDSLYNVVDKVGSGYVLVANNTTGLSTQLVGGLYRYQGVQDANNNVDNYICFGTTNKSDCISDTDKYMYRIIGINTSGQMKLIKKETLNTTYQWNSINNGVEWPSSDLFAGLNGSYFLTNVDYVPDSSWSNRISINVWKYGDLASADSTALEMYNTEMGLSGTTSAKIGLLYLHDWYYGLVGGNNCSSENYKCQTSWLPIPKNDSASPNSTLEWTLMRADNKRIWGIDNSSGFPFSNGMGMWMDRSYSVRPVFFLKATETIASGSGTITDPYILS